VDVSCGGLFFCTLFGGCVTDDGSVCNDFIGSGEFLDEVMDLRDVDLFELFWICEIGDLTSTRD
jgi:hypothetical protein